MRLAQWITWSLRIRRVEYRVAELPIFFIPVFLSISRTGELREYTLWEGLVAFLFMMAFGDLLNCLADRDLDAAYKPHLTEAVYGLGIRGVIAQAVLSGIGATLLCAHLAWALDHWILLPAALIGLFVAYAYSVEPFRLKGRGLWQLAFYWAGLFTGPMVFAALLVRPWPPLGTLSAAIAYGMMQTGVILVNTAEDYPEDRAMGVDTVVVALGLPRSIAVSLRLTLLGGLLLTTTLIAIGWLRSTPPLRLAGILPLVLSFLAVATAIARLERRLRGATEPAQIQAVKEAARWVPLGITAPAVTSLIASIALSPL